MMERRIAIRWSRELSSAVAAGGEAQVDPSNPELNAIGD